MDPHFSRKPPASPPSLSSSGGGGSAGGSSSSSSGFGPFENNSASGGSLGGSGPDGGAGLAPDSALQSARYNPNQVAAAAAAARETEDQLNLAIKNTLACVREILRQPAGRSRDLVRGFISDSLAPATNSTVTSSPLLINSSHLIELSTLTGNGGSGPDDESGLALAPNATSHLAAAATTSTSESRAVVDLLKLYDHLPASTSPLPLDALSHEWQVLLVVIYSLTAITSFLLNMITVVVLSRCQRTELRKYLINLSLSDLLMSMFSIPFTYTEYMLGHWLFGAFLCPFIRFVVTLSVFVSIATMTVIGINRHLAIMYPLKRKNNSKWRHWTSWNKTHVIVGIWVLGTAISLPEYLAFAQLPFCYNNLLYYECRNTWPESIANPYTIFIFLSTFAIPLALLSYLYTSIGLKLWRRQMPGNVHVNRDLTMQSKRAKVVKMLLVVVVLFAVMWLPLQTFSMVNFLNPDIRGNHEYASRGYNIFVGTYFVCHWLGMAHSCVSPLVYCFMNKKFRTDLRNLLCPLPVMLGGPGGLGGGGGGGLGGGGGSKSYFESSYNGSLASGVSSAGAFRGTGGGSGSNHHHHHHLRPGGGGGSPMNSSNSVRAAGAGGGGARATSRASQLSKTNSLSSLRTSTGASSCRRLTAQTSSELRPVSEGAATAAAAVAVTSGDIQQTPCEPNSLAEKKCRHGQQIDELITQDDGPSSSYALQMSNNTSPRASGQASHLFAGESRPALMSKLSAETSAAETLHEIDEESEDNDDDDDEKEADEEDDDEEDEEEEDEDDVPQSGRLVTLRQHAQDYAILRPANGASGGGDTTNV